MKEVVSPKEFDLEVESLSDDEQPLPDGGFGWVVVGASFMVSFIVYGLIYTYNFVYEHYMEQAEYQTYRVQLELVGTVNLAVLNFSCLVMGRVDDRLGHRRCIMIGASIYTLGLVISAFVESAWLLILTQGVMLGLGGSMASIATISAPMQWFDKRRGLASGIAMAGCGLGGLFLALVVPEVLKLISIRAFLLIFAAFSFVTMMAAALVIRDQPKSESMDDIPWYDCTIMKNPMFLLLLLGNTVATFGYIVPSYKMLKYVEALGLTKSHNSYILSMVCLAASISRVIGGAMADKLGACNMLILSLITMFLSCSIVWVLSKTLVTLLIFGFLFGFGMGGFVSLPPMITSKLFGLKGLSTTNGWLYFTAGIPSLCGVYIATAIIDSTPASPTDVTGTSFYAIQYAGATALVGAVFIFWLKLMNNRNPFAKI
ncbi:hypothetical protein DSO57_1031339 [Entomophthora muscae]|uniref:Uncharacterized protein n=1 Tax=Entomophthora muscae TaxID=34485 RepID=A0ACC2ULH1_9FUNG|nr:hypothetical protein DSO57_1031339 [Entomophthora muscae]